MSETITTPVGRLVEGSLYRGNDKDMAGQPKFFRDGRPRTDYYFALAIPKGNETHWSQTEWGQVIQRVGKLAFPLGQSDRPDFSWKITDGDSTLLDKANPPRRPCDKEGFKGSWVLKFANPTETGKGLSPRIYNRDGSQLISEADYVNLGDYVQVHALIKGNESDQQSGVYLNPLMVAFQAFGPRIVKAADPKAVGFGNAPLPAGASATPPAAFVPPVDMGKEVPSYPQILNVPAPPPASARVMLPAAQGTTYEQYKQAGWTDEQMIQAGVMQG